MCTLTSCLQEEEGRDGTAERLRDTRAPMEAHVHGSEGIYMRTTMVLEVSTPKKGTGSCQGIRTG
jgi:hypothetical protein